MFNPFKVNVKLHTKFTPETAIQPESPIPNSETVTTVKDASGELERLTQNEKTLLREKEQLVKIIEELQYMLSVEIETKQQVVGQLEDEIPELRHKCEEIANALRIPVIK